jgi:hypothetical protein
MLTASKGECRSRVAAALHTVENAPLIDASTPKACAECGNSDARVLEKDHILPRAEGGSDDPSNRQWLCRNCHGIKSREDFSRFLSLRSAVVLLPDGRVEVIFGKPLPDNQSSLLLLVLGNRRANELLVRDDYVIGVRCARGDWEDVIRLYVSGNRQTKLLRQFNRALA